MAEQQYIPPEIILEIISHVPPKNPRAILSPTDPTSRTLLSLSLVSKLTRQHVKPYIGAHCIYLDSEARLDRFLNIPMAPRPDFHHITALYLAPFTPRLGPVQNFPTGEWSESMVDTIDHPPTAKSVRDLLFQLGPHLKRIIVDIPLRSLYPGDDFSNVRRNLRDGFEFLASLEELVSVRDELYLDVNEPTELFHRDSNLIEKWKNLKKVALYNVYPDRGFDSFWSTMAGLLQLDTLVLTRDDGTAELTRDAKQCLNRRREKKVKVLRVNAFKGNSQYNFHQLQHPPPPLPLDPDPEGLISVMWLPLEYVEPGDGDPHYEDEIGFCQNWVRKEALKGELWDHEGEPQELALED